VLDKATQQAVRDRAGHRCEYCYFPESLAELPFHFDHVIAQQHGGATTLDNLALACCYCNRYKGPNVASIDQRTGEVVEAQPIVERTELTAAELPLVGRPAAIRANAGGGGRIDRFRH
jgi:5-methylcytosine-specific restriction endonuclease McrA